MTISPAPLLVSALSLVCAASLFAQGESHEHAHHADAPVQYGRVHLPIGCNEGAQEAFDRADAMLHSFEYEEAERTFAESGARDPACAMSYWGIAMTHWHPIWEPPGAAELKKGLEASARAAALGGKTDREREYIAAITAFFQDWPTSSHTKRTLAIKAAMERMHAHFPDDEEAAVFYALSLISSASPADLPYVMQKEAGAILESVFRAHPDHPGAAHYIIHAYDYPGLASLALPAARSYARIAPAAPHALHMPSHIFTRLGLWQESVDTNLASAAVASKYNSQFHPGASSRDELHSLDYLVYADLQIARDKDADAIASYVESVKKVEPEDPTSAATIAEMRARCLLERGQWAKAKGLPMPPASMTWSRYPYALADVHFARSVGASRGHDAATAAEELQSFKSLQMEHPEQSPGYRPGDETQFEVEGLEASAWLAHAKGDDGQAISLMRRAAAVEDARENRGLFYLARAREWLGELLLEARQPGEALAELQQALGANPNRFRGLAAAVKAARRSGDISRAREYALQLVTQCEHADSPRPELDEARELLNQK